ncbi:LOW QUALITY PROTEIN: seizure 6-like protein [Athene cunicularia]|uniref:LOW QUALITY PROTEIN: seizure 6-like protein n=1 Tax=Athene cunicularia TaxID=194338 RepID=UPI000EF70EDC|nr:LOW QUALITY PROTEIN: seizure 6-like protein [Athene cunicularia]
MSPSGRAAGVRWAAAPRGADFVPPPRLSFHARNCPSPTFPHFLFADSGSGAALVPASPDPLTADELVDKTVGGAGELGHATALNLLPATEEGTEPAAETTLLVRSHIPPTPTTAPNADAKQTFPVKKKPPTLKQVNTARKHPRPKPTQAGPPRAASPASPLGSGLPTASQELRTPAEAAAGVGDVEQSPPELPWGSQATTSHPVLQISPSTLPPAAPRPFPDSLGDAADAPTVAPTGAAVSRTNGAEREVYSSESEESQETTTSTIVTTTITTTEPTPVLCSMSFHDPEGYIDSTDYPPLPLHSYLECTYNVTVYTGYGVELQVKSVNLSDGEVLSIRGVDGDALVVLANQTLLVEGQVIRSPTNTISVYFRTFQDEVVGTFQLHYQVFMLSCNFPRRPDFGDVTVMDLHSGGIAHFHCHLGYELQGPRVLTCINASRPHWSSPEPICSAPCGGTVRNATIGRVLSPSYAGNHSGSMYCVWAIGAPPGQKLHLHFEKLLLTDKDRPAPLLAAEVSRNDSCSDLPEIQNGWKTTSHTELVRGAKITYQCDPGYDIVGSDTLTCQWDLSWSSDPPFCEKIMYCTDPGEVEHSTRLISDPVLLVGTTIQYTCNPGFVLEGSSLLTCYSRETGTPIWTSRLPHCVSEESLACDNPGLPENGYQILYKRLYLPGESLTFMCYEGFELMGEVTIKCILGQPSHWSGPLPICKVNQDSFEHALEVAEAAAETSLEGGNMALAIFIPVLIISLLLGGAYIYLTRCRYYSSLRLPLMYSHPYSQITVETEFDNPIYETGETREYEVSI